MRTSGIGKSARALGAALGALAGGTPAYAAPADAAPAAVAPSDEGQEIIVTANKREERLRDVASAITAVTADNIEKRQLLDVQDLSKQVPGFSVQTASPGFNRLILRGQNSGGTGATVATVVDDMPFNFSNGTNNSGLLSANIDTYDLARVEVLRGPQGTLYGASAEGGLIKYVTNKPNLTALSAGIEAGGSTVEHGEAAGSVKGVINVPIFNDKLALRVSGYYEGLPGYIDNPLAGTRDVNHGRKYGARASLLFKPDEDFSIRLGAFFQGLRDGDSGQVQVVGSAATPNSPPPDEFSLVGGLVHNSYNPSFTNNDLVYYSGTIDWDVHFAKLTSITSYGTIKNRFGGDTSDFNVIPGLTFAQALAGVFGQPISTRQRQVESLHKFNQEVRLASEPGGKLLGLPLDWQIGAFYTHESSIFDQAFDALSLAAPFTVLAPPGGGSLIHAKFEEWAIFGEATYHFTPKLDLSFGARDSGNTQNSQEADFCCIVLGPDRTGPTIHSSDNSFTYSVAPRWHITDDTLLYGRVASGYRPGGPNFGAAAGLGIVPTSFGPDSTTNYEIGLRTALFDRKVTVDVAAYLIDWNKIQVSAIYTLPNGQTVNVNGNGGKATSKGLEWNFGWTPLAGLRLGVIGAYTDAHLTEDAPGIHGVRGDQLAYVPDVGNTVNVDYERRAFGDFKGFAGASWSYVGTRYADLSASAVIENHARLPTYNLFSAQLGLEDGKYSIEFYGKNLSDKRAIVSYVSSGGHNQTGLANIVQPRTFGIILSAKY